MTPHLLPMPRPGERGLSLLELIVVLAILSLVLVAVAPLVNPWHRGTMIDVAARDLALALRETRAAAIYGNKGTSFTLDGGAGQYWSDAAPARRTLPARITATFAAGQAQLGQIQFFPDGGASGGTIVLRDAHRSAAVRVDALSGRVKFNVRP
jgi:prepilin-type N-terminal cleavage/methylation domain-containing protein